MSAQQRIFLGHASEDKPRVRDLHAQLKAKGFSPWLDAVDLIPGQNWRDEIPKAIKGAGVFLACLSQSSVAKQSYVQREFRYALAAYAERPPGSIYLIPVRLDDCEVPEIRLSELELNLRDLHWVDLFEHDGMDRLIQAIGHALGGTASDQTHAASSATEKTAGRPASDPVTPSAKAADARHENDANPPSPTASSTDAAPQKPPASPSPNTDALRAAVGPSTTLGVASISIGLVVLLGVIAVELFGPEDPVDSSIAAADSAPAAVGDNSASAEPAAQLPASPGSWADAYQPFESFRECDQDLCPEMILLPAGIFLMGSPDAEEDRDDDEGPQHEVTISQILAMGKYEVTFEEYDLFADTTGRDKPDDRGARRLPVMNVSWDDANAYCAWLGQGYRLPNEAEWEYAARAGTSTPFSFGETITPDQVNYQGSYPYGDGEMGLYRGKAITVGSLRANAWGLHDMHGNVWEWVADWDSDYAAAAVMDPRGPSTGTRRVLRGGSWISGARYARAAYRNAYDPGIRHDSFGFRCARAQGA